MKTAVKYSVIYATVLMIIGFTLFQTIPGPLLMMFNASENMLAMGIPCLRIISISFLLAGYCIICGSTFQAVGHGFMSMWVSIGRQLLALLPIAFLLSRTGILNLVWWCYPLAELVSVTLATIFLRKIIKTIMNPIDPNLNSLNP